MARSDNENVRKIKEINGHKVNHPFSVANIFYGIFLLLLCAVPVSAIFLPLIKMPIADAVYEVKGLDLIKYLIINPLKSPTEGMEACRLLTESEMISGDIVAYIFLGQAILLAVLVLLSVIGLIFFIVLMIKGYLRHSKGVKNLAGWYFIFALLFSLSFMAQYIFAALAGNTDYLIPWFSFVPAGASLIIMIVLSSIYSANFRGTYCECDLEYRPSEEEKATMAEAQKEVFTPVAETAPEEPFSAPLSGDPTRLPPDLMEIGDHAFSANQDLMVANIPMGINSLGPSAFSNCLNLLSVSIPASVTDIGYNCFFNCALLEKMKFEGTMEEFNKITKGSNWLTKTKVQEIICNDGNIKIENNNKL